MKVKLKVSRAVRNPTTGAIIQQGPGTVITVTDAEGTRMVTKGQAVAEAAPNAPKALKKPTAKTKAPRRPKD